MEWIVSVFSEPGTKNGSMQRVALFLLVVTVLVLVVLLTLKGGKFPDVPSSLETTVEYLGSLLVGGIAFGKLAPIVQAAKGVTIGPDQPAQ